MKQVNLIIKSFIILIILACVCQACNEHFKSLTEIRKMSGFEDYGPSFKELFNFEKSSKIDCKKVICHKTELAISEDYAYSTQSIAGRKITETVSSNINTKRLLEVVFDYDNYGDIVLGVLKPDYAFEFICGKDTFVVNYSSNQGWVSISSPHLKQEMFMPQHVSSILVISPHYQKMLNEYIKKR